MTPGLKVKWGYTEPHNPFLRGVKHEGILLALASAVKGPVFHRIVNDTHPDGILQTAETQAEKGTLLALVRFFGTPGKHQMTTEEEFWVSAEELTESP